MTLPVGTRLGPYEVLAPIGAGGMGDVYLGRDTRLGRTVAIKTSRENFGERFEREAWAIAQLNHPHICTLYDVGPNYLVMEHIDGRPLTGPLPLPDVIRLGSQIAEALDAAHRKGITHRDLKPANVLVTPTGVKLLDFGLAKPHQPEQQPADDGPTLHAALTVQGTILGTPQYMAPEQLESKSADARSDIWAFGCVLYEMVTGKRAFEGKSVASTIATVLAGEPPAIETIQPTTPPSIDRLIRRCLRKDPEERWQAARDVMWELQAAADPGEVKHASSGNVRLRWLPWATAALLSLSAGAAAWMLKPEQKIRAMQLDLLPPDGTILASQPAISPDGRLVAFAARREDGTDMIFVRGLDGSTPKPLAGTEGARGLFWSPNGRRLGFASRGKLRTVGVDGGDVQTLTDAPFGEAGSGAWSRNDVILFTEIFKPMQKISALGGAVEPVFARDAPQPGFRGQRFPVFLPDGTRFLFLGTGFGALPVVSAVAMPLKPGLYVAALDSSPPRFITSEVTGLFSLVEISKGTWYLLFTANGQVLAKRFDTDQLAFSGEAIPLVRATTFSASSDGTLVFLKPRVERGNARLLWVSSSGQKLTTLLEASGSNANSPSISPDQKRVAYTIDRDVWLIDVTNEGRSRFTLDSRNPSQSGPNEMAVWSHDQRQITYASVSRSRIVRRLASGAGQDEILYQQESAGAWPLSWSPDERWLSIMTVGAAGTGFDIALLPTFGDRKPIPFKNTAATEKHLQFSPNGRWLAYSSDESGAEEIYIEGVPETAGGSSVAQGRWQVSTGGGAQPRWRGDGKELFFVSPDGQMMSVLTETATNEFRASSPKTLFQTSIRTSAAPIYQYDVTSDGRRFLIAEPPDGTRNSAISVVLNWPTLLKSR